jgi:Spy/CpxP family protein refolding chaperone
MLQLVASAEPDGQAIAAKQEEILAGQRQMQRLVIGRLLAEKEVLTPGQQEAFFGLMRRQCQNCVGRGPWAGLVGQAAGGGPAESPAPNGSATKEEGN